LAIELRADQAATQTLSKTDRKNYAALLLNVQRPARGWRGVLPCPTAHLGSSQHRNVKMRLTTIMEKQTPPLKTRWTTAVIISAIGASLLGATTSAAINTIEVRYLDFDPIEYAKKTRPQLPASCPGLKREDLKFESSEIMVGGNPVMQYRMVLGVVGIQHDVRRDGTIHNPRVLFSTNSCFEEEAKAAIILWQTEPQSFELRDAGVKLPFMMTADTTEDLKRQLDDYLP